MATERHGSLAAIPLDAVASISADLAPRVGLHPGTALGRPAQGRPGREERRPPMIIKLAIALVVVLIVAAFAAWAFLPCRHLPGNRARHLRIRLHLRLHPGKGFAHAFSLWLRWSRFAVLRRSGRIRPAPPAGLPVSWTRASTRCSSAGLTTGTACASRLLVSSDIRTCCMCGGIPVRRRRLVRRLFARPGLRRC